MGRGPDPQGSADRAEHSLRGLSRLGPHPRDHVSRGTLDRSSRGRRHRLGTDLRLVRGDRPRSRGGQQEPARVQPQFFRTERSQGRSDLSLLAPHRGRLRAHGSHHRSARHGGGAAPPLSRLAGGQHGRHHPALARERGQLGAGAQGTQYQGSAAGPTPRRLAGPPGADQARRQGLDGRHLPLGHRGPRLPLQCARHRRVHVQERGPRLRRASQGRRLRHPRGRRDLRPGLLARGRRPRPIAPGRARGPRQELRPDPPRQLDQLGTGPARVRRPGHVRYDRAWGRPETRRHSIRPRGGEKDSRHQ